MAVHFFTNCMVFFFFIFLVKKVYPLINYSNIFSFWGINFLGIFFSFILKLIHFLFKNVFFKIIFVVFFSLLFLKQILLYNTFLTYLYIVDFLIWRLFFILCIIIVLQSLLNLPCMQGIDKEMSIFNEGPANKSSFIIHLRKYHFLLLIFIHLWSFFVVAVFVQDPVISYLLELIQYILILLYLVQFVVYTKEYVVKVVKSNTSTTNVFKRNGFVRGVRSMFTAGNAKAMLVTCAECAKAAGVVYVTLEFSSKMYYGSLNAVPPWRAYMLNRMFRFDPTGHWTETKAALAWHNYTMGLPDSALYVGGDFLRYVRKMLDLYENIEFTSKDREAFIDIFGASSTPRLNNTLDHPFMKKHFTPKQLAALRSMAEASASSVNAPEASGVNAPSSSLQARKITNVLRDHKLVVSLTQEQVQGIYAGLTRPSFRACYEAEFPLGGTSNDTASSPATGSGLAVSDQSFGSTATSAATGGANPYFVVFDLPAGDLRARFAEFNTSLPPTLSGSEINYDNILSARAARRAAEANATNIVDQPGSTATSAATGSDPAVSDQPGSTATSAATGGANPYLAVFNLPAGDLRARLAEFNTSLPPTPPGYVPETVSPEYRINYDDLANIFREERLARLRAAEANATNIVDQPGPSSDGSVHNTGLQELKREG